MAQAYTDFIKPLETLGRRHDLARVFNDLLTIGICSFHRTNLQSLLTQQDGTNEALYMETIKRYKGEDLKLFGKAMAMLQLNVLNDPYSDVLGQFFMEHITKGQNGQYFTSEHMCDMMVEMTIPPDYEDKRILDPACGSGRMLLSAAKLSYQNLFFGADNSNTCAKMVTLNFFLNGLRGEVAWMDSLAMEWYGGWKINHAGLGIVPIEKEQSEIWSDGPKPKAKTETPESDKAPRNKTEQPILQLTLF